MFWGRGGRFILKFVLKILIGGLKKKINIVIWINKNCGGLDLFEN